MKLGVQLIFFIIIFCKPVHGQHYILDSSFGTKGISRMLLPGDTSGAGMKCHVQQDGKIIIAGIRSIPIINSSLDDITPMLVRFKNDGTIDSSYGLNGSVLVTQVNSDNYHDAFPVMTYWAAFQNDNKVIVMGSAGADTFEYIGDSTEIIRYTASGKVDTTYNHTGKAVTHFPGFVPFLYGLKIQPDGKLLAVGKLVNLITSLEYGPLIIRYKTNGLIDSTFGTNGYLLYQSSIQFTGLIPMIQNNGKIVIGGESKNINGGYTKHLMRINQNGTIDNSYGNNGIVTLAGSFLGLFIDSSTNKIYQFNNISSSVTDTVILNRYDTSGAIDTSFNSTGKFQQIFNTRGISFNSLIIFPDSKILFEANLFVGDLPRHVFVKLNSNGKLDTTFADRGIDTATFIVYPSNIPFLFCYNYYSELQPDGKIILTGISIDPAAISLNKQNLSYAVLQASSIQYKTVKNGTWNNASTWENNVVPPTNVSILVKHNVVVTTNTKCYSVKIISPGSIIVNTGINFEINH